MKRVFLGCFLFLLSSPGALTQDVIDVEDEELQREMERRQILEEIASKHTYRGLRYSPIWFDRAFGKYSGKVLYAEGEFMDPDRWAGSKEIDRIPPTPETRYRRIPGGAEVLTVLNDNEILVTERYSRSSRPKVSFHLKGIDTEDLADGAPVMGKAIYSGNYQYATLRLVETDTIDDEDRREARGEAAVVGKQKYVPVAGTKHTVQSFIYCGALTYGQFAAMLEKGDLPGRLAIPPPRRIKALKDTCLYDEYEKKIGPLAQETEVELLHTGVKWYKVYHRPEEGEAATGLVHPGHFSGPPVYLEAVRDVSARSAGEGKLFQIPAESRTELLQVKGSRALIRYWLPKNEHVDLIVDKKDVVEADAVDLARSSIQTTVATKHAFGSSIKTVPCQVYLVVTLSSYAPLSDVEVRYRFYLPNIPGAQHKPGFKTSPLVSGTIPIAKVGPAPVNVQTKFYSYTWKPYTYRTNRTTGYGTTYTTRKTVQQPPKTQANYKIEVCWRGCIIKTLRSRDFKY